jgi:hypothetical protein
LFIALVGGLILVFLLNLVADQLRDRVDVVRSPERLVVRNQQAALRLDGLILFLCTLGLLGALAIRALPLAIVAAAAVAAVGWRLRKTMASPAFVFDRGANGVWRDRDLICDLSAVQALKVTPDPQRSALDLHYRGPQGDLRALLLYRARPPRVAALHAALTDFLGTGSTL